MVWVCLFPDLPLWLPISQPVGWSAYTCSPVCFVILAACLSIHLSVWTCISTFYFIFKLTVTPAKGCVVCTLIDQFQFRGLKFSLLLQIWTKVQFVLWDFCFCHILTIKFDDCLAAIVYSPLITGTNFGMLHMLWMWLIGPQAWILRSVVPLLLTDLVLFLLFCVALLSVLLWLGLDSAELSCSPPHPSLAATEKLPNSSFFRLAVTKLQPLCRLTPPVAPTRPA